MKRTLTPTSMSIDHLSGDAPETPKQQPTRTKDPMAEIAALEAQFVRPKKEPPAQGPEDAASSAKQEEYGKWRRLADRKHELSRVFDQQMQSGDATLDQAWASLHALEVTSDAMLQDTTVEPDGVLDLKKEHLYHALMNADRYEDGARLAATIRNDGARERFVGKAQRAIEHRDTEQQFVATFAAERAELTRLMVAGSPQQLAALQARIRAKLDAELAKLDPANDRAMNALYGASGINEVDHAVKYPRRAA